ncbi:MAG: zf-HC2 domain-containing protein [Planctomycetota bacterium]
MNLFHRDDPCVFVNEKLELFLDGELTGSENLAFQTHLKECESCAAYWSDDEEVSTALMLAVAPDRVLASDHLFSPGMPETTPSRTEFDRRHDTERRPPMPTLRWKTVASWGLAAAALVGISFGGGMFFDRAYYGESAAVPAPVSRVVVAASEAPLLSLRAGGLQVRPAGSEVWSRFDRERGQALGEGLELLAEQGEGDLVLQVEGAGMMVLSEGSILGLRALPVDSAEPFDVELVHGTATLHIRDHGFEFGLPAGRLEGRDATLVLRAHQLEESVLVLRGHVELRTDEGVESLQAGDSRQLRPSPQGAALEAISVSRIAELESLLGGLRGELESVVAANQFLQYELTLLRSSSELQAANEDTPAVIIASYLHVVDQTNSVRLNSPSPLTIQTATRLRDFGAEAVTTLVGVFNSEDAELRRIAVMALIAEIALPDTRRALERACFDREAKMRRAALFCLNRLPDVDLSQHFLTVARADLDEWVKYRAASYAAERGEGEGVTILATIYHETKDRYRRSHVVSNVARLEGDIPAATRFLRTVLADRNSGRFSLLSAVRGLVKRGDVASLAAMRDLLDRADLSPDVRGRVEEAIHDLEID